MVMARTSCDGVMKTSIFMTFWQRANTNPFRRFSCELINEMIRRFSEFRNDTPQAEHKRFGQANVKIHKAITKAARERDAEKVRELM